jgi:hypothetical protein
MRPTGKKTVMALLAEAGQDVSYWSRNADGSEVKTPAANPNYCYDWAFGSRAEVIVLCVWFESIDVVGPDIVFESNMRKLDEDLSAVAASGNRSTQDRDRARQQATRARSFDNLVKVAFDSLLPVRLILNEGDRASEQELGSASSEVRARELDPEPWFVHRYDDRTGQFLMVRSRRPSGDLDGVESAEDGDATEDERQLAAIKIRRGQADFRERLLRAWKSECVVTRSRVVGLLEAAHIKPHAEAVDYRTSNGLLLRADIHTLFDLGLLSIDEFMRVHLAEDLKFSEYRQYDGRQIERRPDSGADAPSVEALRERHRKFLQR